MKRCCLWILLLNAFMVTSHADDTPTLPASVRPRQSLVTPPATGIAHTDPVAHDAKFVSEATWGVAGYNNNEVFYAVFVTNQDTGILRCTTDIKGYYYDNGTKLSIADRQLTTVFPNVPTQVGIWMDMDQASGATYAVTCHSL